MEDALSSAPGLGDALAAELVEVRRDDRAGGSSVALTDAGRAVLADASHSTIGDRTS